jgi:hypothetical protein
MARRMSNGRNLGCYACDDTQKRLVCDPLSAAKTNLVALFTRRFVWHSRDIGTTHTKSGQACTLPSSPVTPF